MTRTRKNNPNFFPVWKTRKDGVRQRYYVKSKREVWKTGPVDVVRDKLGRFKSWAKAKVSVIYWRCSLFLYQVIKGDPTPIIYFWRATCYTVGKPAKKSTLRQILEDYTEKQLVEPKYIIWRPGKKAWEEEQVEPSEGRGFRWGWVDVAIAQERGRDLIYPEKHVAWVNLSAWEAAHTGLGSRVLRFIPKAHRTRRKRRSS